MFNTHRGDEVLASTSDRDDLREGRERVWGALQRKTEVTGGVTLDSDGKAIELTGEPDETNSIQEPTKIVPVEHTLSVRTAFEHTFPPHSVTVVELHTHPKAGRDNHEK